MKQNKEKQILIVDDDRDLSETLSDLCKLSKYETHISDNGREGLLRVYSLNPDLVILDMNLPDFDGLDVIKEIRTKSKVPLIILSGRVEKSDRILALELGADDYITKPFDNMELMSRIKVILRRSEWNSQGNSSQNESADQLQLAFPWFADFSSMCIRSLKTDHEINLTNREVSILERFASSGDAVVDKATLLASIGYPRNYENGPLEVCLSRLKNKFIKDNIPYPIKSVRGVGYKFVCMHKED